MARRLSFSTRHEQGESQQPVDHLVSPSGQVSNFPLSRNSLRRAKRAARGLPGWLPASAHPQANIAMDHHHTETTNDGVRAAGGAPAGGHLIDATSTSVASDDLTDSIPATLSAKSPTVQVEMDAHAALVSRSTTLTRRPSRLRNELDVHDLESLENESSSPNQDPDTTVSLWHTVWQAGSSSAEQTLDLTNLQADFPITITEAPQRFESVAMDRGSGSSSNVGSSNRLPDAPDKSTNTSKDSNEESSDTTSSRDSKYSDESTVKSSTSSTSNTTPPPTQSGDGITDPLDSTSSNLPHSCVPCTAQDSSADLNRTLSLYPTAIQGSPENEGRFFQEGQDYPYQPNEELWPAAVDMSPSSSVYQQPGSPLPGLVDVLEVSPEHHGGPEIESGLPVPLQSLVPPAQSNPTLGQYAASDDLVQPPSIPLWLQKPVAKRSQSMPETLILPSQTDSGSTLSTPPLPRRPSTPAPSLNTIERTTSPTPSTSSRSSRKTKRNGFASWINGIKDGIDSGAETTRAKIQANRERKREKGKRRASSPDVRSWNPDREPSPPSSSNTGYLGTLFGKKRTTTDSPPLCAPVGRRPGEAPANWGGEWAGMDGRDGYTRFPLHIERAIYRLSHFKLANPRREMREQVLISCFMFSYLSTVQATGEGQVIYPSTHHYNQAQGMMGFEAVQVQEEPTFQPELAPWSAGVVPQDEVIQQIAPEHVVAIRRQSPSPPNHDEPAQRLQPTMGYGHASQHVGTDFPSPVSPPECDDPFAKHPPRHHSPGLNSFEDRSPSSSCRPRVQGRRKLLSDGLRGRPSLVRTTSTRRADIISIAPAPAPSFSPDYFDADVDAMEEIYVHPAHTR